MSGVSIDSNSNLDLNAIVAGGDAFMARIKELQATKAQADAALDSYNIGRNVVAAMAQAQAREQAALTLVADATAEAEKIVAAAKAQAAIIAGQAQSDAEAIMAKAQTDAAALDRQVKTAHDLLSDWSAKTTADAEQIMAQAVAAKAAADKRLADSEQVAKDLEVARAQAKATNAAANAMQATLTAKLEAIKAAAS